MNCRHYKNELIELARTGAQPTAELAKHLQGCADCLKSYESQKQLSSALESLKKEDLVAKPNVLLQQRLLAKLQNPERTHSFVWMKAAAVLVISLLCGSIWIYQKEYRQNQSDKENSTAQEKLSDYVPLTYGMAPGESLQRVRVKLPRSAFDDFGIALKQARSDEITADVIVGESGVPYAIRVVQQSR